MLRAVPPGGSLIVRFGTTPLPTEKLPVVREPPLTAIEPAELLKEVVVAVTAPPEVTVNWPVAFRPTNSDELVSVDPAPVTVIVPAEPELAPRMTPEVVT